MNESQPGTIDHHSAGPSQAVGRRRMFGCKGGRLTNRCHSFGIILLTLCSVLLVEHIVEVAKLHEQKPMTS